MPFPPSIDPSLDLPLTPGEKRLCQETALQGETPPLGLVRWFALPFRKGFLSSPKAIEKSKVTRNSKPAPPTPDQIDFF